MRTEELIEDRPELVAVIRPLLAARKAIEEQVHNLDRRVLKLARHDMQVRRFMTVPGVGPVTALCFTATIDDPTRFKRSRSVGAYVGLTTRRHASGEVDWSGRISKCGDAMLRMYLFEAAGVLLTRVAVVRSPDFLCTPEKATALATLIRQRRLAPSCGGHAPTAGENSGPGKDDRGELDTQTRN